MASLPARVWHAFTSLVAPSGDPTKVDSAKHNADLKIFLGTICDALSRLDAGADKLPFFTGASSAQMTTLSAFGRLVIAADGNAAARALLGAVNVAGDTMTGSLSFGGTGKVTGLAAPSAATDAVRKQDLDAVVSAIAGALIFKGGWDASSGVFPGGGTAQLGAFYKVTVAGTVLGRSFSVGDDIYAVTNNASTSQYAGHWLKIEGSITQAEVEAAVGFTFGTLASASAVAASQISDASANGRSLIMAANYAAMKALLAVAVADITDASANGPSLISAANYSAMRTLLGLVPGTSAGNIVQLDGSAKLPAVDGSQLTNVSAAAPKVLHVRDERASGTSGGSATTGAWTARVLNTVSINEISGASLASNQVTLPAGTYEVQARAPMANTDWHRIRLRNITDGTTIISGGNAFAYSAYADVSDSTLMGKFTLAATKVLELQYRCTTNSGAKALGWEGATGEAEVYAEAMFKKVG